MNLDASLFHHEPESVEEAWRWVEMLLSEQPHGKSFWQIEQEKERVRDLCRWIREQTDQLLPMERLFGGANDA